MVLLGPALKFKESLSGRFADILAWNYIGFGVLYRYAAQGYPKEDQILVDWSMKYVFSELQKAFDGIYANLNAPGLSWFFKGVVGTWARMNRFDALPSDALGFEAAHLLMHECASRDRLTEGIFVPKNRLEALGRIEFALHMSEIEAKIEEKMKKAIKAKLLPKDKVAKLGPKACDLGIITQDDLKNLEIARAARWEAIQVDDFSKAEYFEKKHESPPRETQKAS